MSRTAVAVSSITRPSSRWTSIARQSGQHTAAFFSKAKFDFLRTAGGLDFAAAMKDQKGIISRFVPRPWRGTNTFQEACWAWRRLPVPVVAVVHGHCLGAGAGHHAVEQRQRIGLARLAGAGDERGDDQGNGHCHRPSGKSVLGLHAPHIPVMIHVYEVTQPQGHSTSGSHERYKTQERLDWEAEYDCLLQMRRWVLVTNDAHGLYKQFGFTAIEDPEHWMQMFKHFSEEK